MHRLRHALSATASPHPKTFSELSAWLRGGSVSVTAEYNVTGRRREESKVLHAVSLSPPTVPPATPPAFSWTSYSSFHAARVSRCPFKILRPVSHPRAGEEADVMFAVLTYLYRVVLPSPPRLSFCTISAHSRVRSGSNFGRISRAKNGA